MIDLEINAARLWASLMRLAEVGAYQASNGLMGVNRLALTDADAQGRALVKRWFEEAGLDVRVDRVGNTYGRRVGRDAHAAVVMSGSHVDSVPTGGAFDGALGLLAALEVVRALDDARVSTRRPIEIAFFTEEEGCRFGTDMLGSATACGRIPLDRAYGLTDRDGISVFDELERHGLVGDVDVLLPPPHAFVELHIEQGPVLSRAAVDVGVVTGMQAISWLELEIVGKTAHAGSTPMELRRDASIAAAKLTLHMNEIARSGLYGADMRATVGRIDMTPNLVNIVPGRAICTIDLRNPDDGMMEEAEREVVRFVDSLVHSSGLEIEVRQTARTSSVMFDSSLMDLITSHTDALHASHQRLVSGAGHDAGELAALCPAGMIFVPGAHDGISHNPREYSSKEACVRGANVLLKTMLDLAE